MSEPLAGRTVVFRGTEPLELQLVESRLELEGLQPLRLGRVHPALAGGGNSAFQQLITVPTRFAPAALALLNADTVDEAELERQALAAAAPLGRPGPPQGDAAPARVRPAQGASAAPRLPGRLVPVFRTTP